MPRAGGQAQGAIDDADPGLERQLAGRGGQRDGDRGLGLVRGDQTAGDQFTGLDQDGAQFDAVFDGRREERDVATDQAAEAAGGGGIDATAAEQVLFADQGFEALALDHRQAGGGAGRIDAGDGGGGQVVGEQEDGARRGLPALGRGRGDGQRQRRRVRLGRGSGGRLRRGASGQAGAEQEEAAQPEAGGCGDPPAPDRCAGGGRRVGRSGRDRGQAEHALELLDHLGAVGRAGPGVLGHQAVHHVDHLGRQIGHQRTRIG